MIQDLSRRTLLTIGGAGAGALALASCSGGGDGGSGAALPAEPVEAATLAELEVGATLSVLVGDVPVLLSRPSDGEVRAFSAVCTHQGCRVAASDGSFICPCHSSEFDPASGEPLSGPALQPLPEYTVTLEGDAILVSA